MILHSAQTMTTAIDVKNYDDAQVSGSMRGTAATMAITLPSGAAFVVPNNEVLSLRDLCDSYLKTYGATDIYGRAVKE